MPDHRSGEPLQLSPQRGRSVTALWLISEHQDLPSDVELSLAETAWMQGMASARAVEFRRSRLWMRRCLADGFGVDPAVVPLQSPPGEPPTLADGWGYVSLSHCCEAVFVAWSPDAVGVDLERSDRRFPAAALADRFFEAADRRELDGLSGEPLRWAVLKQWVAKEALIKMQRGSLAVDLSRWRCGADACQGVHPELVDPVPVLRLQLNGWLMAVASGAGQVGPICLA